MDAEQGNGRAAALLTIEEHRQAAQAEEALKRARATANACTDAGNAKRFAKQHRDALIYVYVNTKGSWRRWDGARWAEAHSEVDAASKATAASIYDEANRIASDRRLAQTEDQAEELAEHRGKVWAWAKQSESARHLGAIERWARSEPGMYTHVSNLDSQPHLLNCANGVLNLDTFEFREGHDPRDLMTKVTRANYVEGSRSERWEEFLTLALPDPELRAFVQRALGESLLGARSDWYAVPYGRGRNGKNTLFDTARMALGDYGSVLHADLITNAREKMSAGEHSMLASLRGVRMATATEVERGRRLAESLVRQLTGEAQLQAKYMGQDMFTFEPTATVFMSVNNLPTITGTDAATWERIMPMPFTEHLPSKLKALGRAPVENYWRVLLEDADAVLWWMVEGLRQRAQSGLNPPAAVVEARGRMRADMDTFQRWVEDCLERGDLDNPEYHTTSAVLWASYTEYMKSRRGVLVEHDWHDRMVEEFGESKKVGPRTRRRWGFKGVRVALNIDAVYAQEEAG
jgi:putative DNA primase/helicase